MAESGFVRWVGLTVVVSSLLAAACAPAPSAAPAESADTTAAQASPDDTSAAVSTDAVEATDAPPATIALEPAFTAQLPTDLVARPGSDRLYVAERAGRVVVFEPGTPDAVAVLVDFSGEVGTEHDQAFMSLTFDPAGDDLFVHFSRAGNGASVLRRYELEGDTVMGSTDLLEVEQPFPDHNGGSIRFGPDGMLYWALGDGGGEVEAMTTAQDTNNLLGSLLRLDPSVDAASLVPVDNPLVGLDGRDEIWLWGLRNPWRISFDAPTGDLWIADVGLTSAEEIDRLPLSANLGRAQNLGWPIREGTVDPGLVADVVIDPESFWKPVLEYDHELGRCSITGGEVYRGSDIADLVGEYVFADFCSGEIMGLRTGTTPRFTVFDPVVTTPVGFGVDLDGELYVLSLDGSIQRIVSGQ